MSEEIRALVDALREETDASLRTAIRYSGDDWDLLFAREGSPSASPSRGSRSGHRPSW